MISSNRIRSAIVAGLAPLEAGAPEGRELRDIRQMNDVLEEIPRNCKAVFLTKAELTAIGHVITNGWGDGDFADNLGRTARTAMRAAEKLGIGLTEM